MTCMNVRLEDWQSEALQDLARDRGMEPEQLAGALLTERLVERIHCAFDDLLSGDSILPSTDFPRAERIEETLRRLFAD